MADLCFLVEWYRPEPGNEPLPETVVRLDECAAATSAEGSPVQLLTSRCLTNGLALFAAGSASSPETVRHGPPLQAATWRQTLRRPDDRPDGS